MPAIEAPADIIRIGLLKQSGGFCFGLHVGSDMIVKHDFDAFQAKPVSDLETSRAVIPGSRLFNTVLGLPRLAENITRS
jgi:hypothetical protein